MAFVHALSSGSPSADREGVLGTLTSHDWVIFSVMVTAGALIGLSVGNILADYIHQFAFKYLLLSILGAGAVMLASVGMTGTQIMILIGTEVAVCVLLICVVWKTTQCLFTHHMPSVHYKVVATEEDRCDASGVELGAL